MTERNIVVIGMPESGKTTFLAALWHLITAEEVATKLRFGGLGSGSVAYLNQIAARWREARAQDRTALAGSRVVSMNLIDGDGSPVRVTFPDVPGEEFARMWEDRECSAELAEILNAGGVLLFVHADTIRAPRWVVDEAALSRRLGLDVGHEHEEVAWHPRLAPTQVQLVDLLQMLRSGPLDGGPRRLAVMLSAWDKVEVEGLTPEAFMESRLPLFAQYLRSNVDSWTWRACGVSAQGGDYDSSEVGNEPTASAEKLRQLDFASQRMRFVYAEGTGHDLTEAVAWLIE